MERADGGHPAKGIHQVCVTVDGVPTDLFMERFSDRVMIIATQNGKLGTIVRILV